jgi:carbamoyl-phosphate synthase large subunit
MNLLVMAAGSIPGVAVIEALRGQAAIPVRIVAADMGRLSAGFLLADAHYTVPGADEVEFIPAIEAICRREKIEVIFPIVDEELQVFADHAARFRDQGIRVITNPAETVRIAKDKLLTAQRCAEWGIATPATFAAADIATQALPPFPLVVKPRQGRGSVGVQVVTTQAELDFFLARTPHAMVQQFIAGAEYTIDVLTDFDGRLLSLVPKERLLVKSGMQTKGRTVHDAQLLDYAAEIVARFRLWPRGNIQCIRDVAGKIWLIEINPKFPASLPFTVAAGVNAPLALLRLHRGECVTPMLGQFKAGLLMLRVWRELYMQT